MKTKVLYFLLIVILSSCGMSKSFNRQKFTSLKKIKPTEQIDPKGEVSPNNDLTIDQSNEPILTIESAIDSPNQLEDDVIIDSDSVKAEESKEPEINILSAFERKISFKHPKKNLIKTISDKKAEIKQTDTDQLLKTNTIVFFIGLLGIIVQFIAFILIVFLELEALLSFSWTGLMAITLIAGLVGIGCLIATFVLAMVYKKECKRNGVEPERGRWYSMWITSIVLAAIFFGNFVITFLIFLNEFSF